MIVTCTVCYDLVGRFTLNYNGARIIGGTPLYYTRTHDFLYVFKTLVFNKRWSYVEDGLGWWGVDEWTFRENSTIIRPIKLLISCVWIDMNLNFIVWLTRRKYANNNRTSNSNVRPTHDTPYETRLVFVQKKYSRIDGNK